MNVILHVKLGAPFWKPNWLHALDGYKLSFLSILIILFILFFIIINLFIYYFIYFTVLGEVVVLICSRKMTLILKLFFFFLEMPAGQAYNQNKWSESGWMVINQRMGGWLISINSHGYLNYLPCIVKQLFSTHFGPN